MIEEEFFDKEMEALRKEYGPVFDVVLQDCDGNTGEAQYIMDNLYVGLKSKVFFFDEVQDNLDNLYMIEVEGTCHLFQHEG